LSHKALRDIVDVRLREVEQRLSDRRIKLNVDKTARDWLGEYGYDPAYGARPLNRLIQKKLLNPLARLLIDGGVRTGETVNVTVTKLPSGQDEILVKRNHAPGSLKTDSEQKLLKEGVSPIGEEEQAEVENDDEKK
jgi:ATP-dependent Clp protease ATP-binding subunit ClpB